MAALPLALSLPAATGALAYLNARYNVTNDLDLLRCIIVSTIRMNVAFKNDTANMFYHLEAHAMSKEKANHPFIAVPPALPSGEKLTPESIKDLQCKEWTYREVYDIVLKYAAWLKNDLGVKKSDVIAFDYTNKPEFIFIWLALWSLGARPAFINTGLRGDSLLHCVRTSSASRIIVDEALREALTDEVKLGLENGIGGNVKLTVVDAATIDRIATMQGHRACDDCRSISNPLDMCQLIFTSGTTGLPKPAVVPWRRFVTTSMLLKDYLELRSFERYYTALPLYHSSGSMLGLGTALYAGITLIVSPHFSPSTFFASLVASKATMFQYIGEMNRYLLSVPRTPFDRAHRIERCFGNGIRPDVWRPFKERYGIPQICEFYGATESPSSTFIKSRNTFGAGAIGRAGPLIRLLRGTQSIIVRHDVETGEPYRDPETGLCIKCEKGEPGELLGMLDPKDIKDKFSGYWGNKEASSKKILRDVVNKGDAYFRTGDILKSDHDGRTFFVDRVGDTFRWKGENVSTGEVEKVIASHPSIKEANVYGVQLPSHDGRAGCAAVVFKDEPTQDLLRSLSTHTLKSLPRFAAPLFLRTVQSMETTGTTKYTKHGLRTQGVEPEKVGGDRLFWLDPKTSVYTEFRTLDWQSISAGQVRL